MNILFLDGYFEPEQTSFTHLEADLLNGFVEAGHTVTVVCPTPTRGVDDETAKKYKKIKTESLYGGKVTVKRFFAPREKSSTALRMLRYLWCNVRQYSVAKKLKNIDAILCDSTPPTQGWLVAKRLKKKLGAPVVYNAQDIFPDSLINAGLTSEGSFICKIGRKIERKTYAAADKILVLGNTFKKNLVGKGVPAEKVEVVYNWIDTETVLPVERKDNRLFDEFSVDREKFVAVYAGNFGASQGADVVIDAAEILKENKNIEFVIFGGGPEFDGALKKAKEKNLCNLKINSLLPVERVPEVYSMGDVAIITCKKGAGTSAMPSKTFSIMACNTPIVASFDRDSELADVLAAANAGFCVEPENAEALADAILAAEKQRPAVNSREFLKETADRRISVGKYIGIFEKVGS